MSATYGGFRHRPAPRGDRKFEPTGRGATRWFPLAAALAAIALVFWTGAARQAPNHPPSTAITAVR